MGWLDPKYIWTDLRRPWRIVVCMISALQVILSHGEIIVRMLVDIYVKYFIT
jgi:hypothetical protein